MRKTTNQTRTDKYKLVADKLLALMEEGTLPWRKPWSSTLCGNAITGRPYSGINPLLAQSDVMVCGYSTTLFVGYKQASSMGWSIRKGSKATWLRLGGKRRKEEIDPQTGETSETFYHVNEWLSVFNLDNIDDSDAATDLKVDAVIARFRSEPNQGARIEDAERLIAMQQANIAFGGNKACYVPTLDKIHLPAYRSFSTPEAYYATAVHELIHRTGHPNRLARPLSGDKDSDEYAFEELVADIGSALVCSMLGIQPDLENHASYLAHWQSLIQRDNKTFFKAFSRAQAAADLLLENAGLLAIEDEAEAA